MDSHTTKIANQFEFPCSELNPFFYDRNMAELRSRWPELATEVENAEPGSVVIVPEGGHTYQCRVDGGWIHGPRPVADECG